MSGAKFAVSDAELCAFLDGELGDARQNEIAAYLSQRPDAAARVDVWRRQGQLIRAGFSRIAQEPVPTLLSATLGENARAPFPRAVVEGEPEPALKAPRAFNRPMAEASPDSLKRSRLRQIGVAVLGLGAVLALIATGMLHGLRQGVSPQPVAQASAGIMPGQSLIRRASEAHRAFGALATLPFDLTGNDLRALALLARPAAFGLLLPKAPPGLQELGLRLAPGETGLAAFILFESESSGRVGLTIERTKTPPAGGLTMRETGGLTIASFVTGDTSYALTGTAPRDQMTAWANRLKDSLR